MPMHTAVRWKDDAILVPKHAGDPQISVLYYEVLSRPLEVQERLKDVLVSGSSHAALHLCAAALARRLAAAVWGWWAL